jgi:hypothetical protein
MIHNHWLCIAYQLRQLFWIMVSYVEPLGVHDGVLYWANGCESWCDILSNWMWIMVSYNEPMVVNCMCYAEPMVVNHGVLCWATGWESWCVMLSQCLWIMVCYAWSVVVNHVELWWASVSLSWCAIFSITHTIHNHWLIIAHHDSHSIAQHITPWFTTIGSV